MKSKAYLCTLYSTLCTLYSGVQVPDSRDGKVPEPGAHLPLPPGLLFGPEGDPEGAPCAPPHRPLQGRHGLQIWGGLQTQP